MKKVWHLFTGLVCLALMAQSQTNNALRLDGVNDWLQEHPVNAQIAQNLTNSTYTLEGWIYPETTSGSRSIFSFNYPSTGNNRLLVRIENDVIKVYYSISSNGSAYGSETSTVTLAANNWYHVAVVNYFGGFRIYLDGVEILNFTTSYAGSVPSNDYFSIGQEYDGVPPTGPSDFFHGMIDEVRIWNSVLTADEIRMNMYKELTGTETDLLAYYKFNQTSGNLVTTSTSNGYNMVLNNGANEWQPSGAFFSAQRALNFSGSDYVDLGAVSDFRISGDLTLEAWVSFDDLNGTQPIISNYANGETEPTNVLYSLYLKNDNKLEMLWEYGSGSNVTVTSTIPADIAANKWYHVAATRDVSSNQATFYLNGQQLGTTINYSNDPSGGSSTITYIGRQQWSGTYLDGKLDEVRIWDVVRTQAEIFENMYKPINTAEPGLCSALHINETSGSHTYNHGTNYHDPTTNYTFTKVNHNAGDILRNPGNFNFWLNTTSTDWSDAPNWASGDGVSSTENVGIFNTGGSFPVLSSGQTILNLGIGSGASITMADGAELSINGSLSNYGTITIESGASFIDDGNITNSGTIVMERILTGSEQSWHMISGPAVVDISENGWNPGSNDDFFAWDEADPGTWVNYKVTSGDLNFPGVNGGDNFVAGKGYLVAYNASNPEKSFTGTPNTGDISYTLRNSGATRDWTYTSGWNLLGNPYPSSIDWNLVDRSQFQDNFAYVYDPNKAGGEGYVSIDGSTAGAFIAPNQGFFVLATTDANSQTFTFSNAIREHGGNFFKNASNKDGIVLRLSDTGCYNETSIRLQEGSDLIRDRFDAIKMYSFNEAIPQLFTLSSDQVPLDIQSIPDIESVQPIALGTRIEQEGYYTISLQYCDEFIGENGIFLEDKMMDVFYELGEESYSFLADKGIQTDRFYLHFGMTDISDIEENNPINIWQQGEWLFLAGVEDFNTVLLIDIPGNMIIHEELNNNTVYRIRVPQSSGVYVVRLLGENECVAQKVFID